MAMTAEERRLQMRAAQKAWREANPERVRENKRNQYAMNPESRITTNRNRRAAKVGGGGRLTAAEWEEIKRLSGGLCVRCRQPGELTQDHVKPLSKGGKHEFDNVQPMCGPCNSVKGTDEIDYRWW